MVITVFMKLQYFLIFTGESVETVLTVTAPLKATVEPATQTVDFGRPAVFTCRYEGNPVKTITWLKDGKDMNHHDPILRYIIYLLFANTRLLTKTKK